MFRSERGAHVVQRFSTCYQLNITPGVIRPGVFNGCYIFVPSTMPLKSILSAFNVSVCCYTIKAFQRAAG